MRQSAAEIEIRECSQEESKNRRCQDSILKRESLASGDKFLEVEEGRAEPSEIDSKMRGDKEIEKRNEEGAKPLIALIGEHLAGIF